MAENNPSRRRDTAENESRLSRRKRLALATAAGVLVTGATAAACVSATTAANMSPNNTYPGISWVVLDVSHGEVTLGDRVPYFNPTDNRDKDGVNDPHDYSDQTLEQVRWASESQKGGLQQVPTAKLPGNVYVGEILTSHDKNSTHPAPWYEAQSGISLAQKEGGPRYILRMALSHTALAAFAAQLDATHNNQTKMAALLKPHGIANASTVTSIDGVYPAADTFSDFPPQNVSTVGNDFGDAFDTLGGNVSTDYLPIQPGTSGDDGKTTFIYWYMEQ